MRSSASISYIPIKILLKAFFQSKTSVAVEGPLLASMHAYNVTNIKCKTKEEQVAVCQAE